jgi:hypothetical protein
MSPSPPKPRATGLPIGLGESAQRVPDAFVLTDPKHLKEQTIAMEQLMQVAAPNQKIFERAIF